MGGEDDREALVGGHRPTARPPMNKPDPLHQLFAIEGGVPVPLEGSRIGADPTRIHDSLDLGVYEALRTFGHDRFVGLGDHLDRLARSMQVAGLTEPLDRGGLCVSLDRIAQAFPSEEAKVRIDHLAGPALQLGSTAHLIVQASELILPPDSVYEQGVGCQLSEMRRVQPQVKQASWVVERRAAEGGGPENFESILVGAHGQLLEGIMSNFFWIRAGTLHTAPVAGVLPGITRGLVMDLARQLGLEVREEHAQAQALENIEEAFFTTSVRSVVPIVRIANQVLGTGQPGPYTGRIMRAYSEFCWSSAAPAVEA